MKEEENFHQQKNKIEREGKNFQFVWWTKSILILFVWFSNVRPALKEKQYEEDGKSISKLKIYVNNLVSIVVVVQFTYYLSLTFPNI